MGSIHNVSNNGIQCIQIQDPGNMKPAGTVVKWKNITLQTQETLSPTFEDHILISVLQLIDSRLPSKIREIYGPRMENEKFLMDFKQDILSNTRKIIEDLDNADVPVNSIQYELSNTRFNPNRQSRQNYRQPKPNRPQHTQTNLKFCRLCHVTRRPKQVVTRAGHVPTFLKSFRSVLERGASA